MSYRNAGKSRLRIGGFVISGDAMERREGIPGSKRFEGYMG